MIKPLNGARVLVTRPAHQAENLSRLIEEQGGVAVRFPTLAIVALDDSSRIKSTLANLDKYQWLVFISANAVTMYGYYSDSDKMAKFKSARIAAIGKATAQALVLAGLPVDLAPEAGYNSEALLAMPQMQQMNGQRCLIVRGEGGRDELAVTLRSRGANVDYLDVYKRAVPVIDS
ncbi:MAG: uroporphyrinogen-III synthase, partial [Methylococcales bacterium]|nr:uroporphyrinogen-III synthase [Methylococcales bacterium]